MNHRDTTNETDTIYTIDPMDNDAMLAFVTRKEYAIADALAGIYTCSHLDIIKLFLKTKSWDFCIKMLDKNI